MVRKFRLPEILIELYLEDAPKLADLKGTNNSLLENVPGIFLSIRLDDENFREEYAQYVSDPMSMRTVPIEYYEVAWHTFAGHPLDSHCLPIRSSLIDPSSISNTYAANKYVVEFTREYLTKKQLVELSLSYRKLRNTFGDDPAVGQINAGLLEKKGVVSEKMLSVAMDMTAKTGWETGVLQHLDEIPMMLVGKGEQSMVKIKLAMEAQSVCQVLLIEEPENHLSHSNLNQLLSHLIERLPGKQLIVATHSSFVLNKLGVDGVLMFSGGTRVSLMDLSQTTLDYFRKLPGHDTLRMILARQQSPHHWSPDAGRRRGCEPSAGQPRRLAAYGPRTARERDHLAERARVCRQISGDRTDRVSGCDGECA